MPKTNAQRQQAWRQRQARRIAALEAEAAGLHAEADGLRADLDAALAECDAARRRRVQAPLRRHRRRNLPSMRHRDLVAVLQGQVYKRQIPESAARAVRRGGA